MKDANKSAKDLEQAIADVTRNGEPTDDSPRGDVLANLMQQLAAKVPPKNE